MLTNEVKVVERFLKCGENCHCFKCTSWGRIKKFLEESCQLPTTAVKTPAAPSSEGEICAHHNYGLSCPFTTRNISCEVKPCNLAPRKLILT